MRQKDQPLCSQNLLTAYSAILTVGNDNALAIGAGIDPIATNNLEIKKNQDSGECTCCQAVDPSSSCEDCCIKVIFSDEIIE